MNLWPEFEFDVPNEWHPTYVYLVERSRDGHKMFVHVAETHVVWEVDGRVFPGVSQITLVTDSAESPAFFAPLFAIIGVN